MSFLRGLISKKWNYCYVLSPDKGHMTVSLKDNKKPLKARTLCYFIDQSLADASDPHSKWHDRGRTSIS